MFLVRGHHELNEVKLKSYFGTEHVEMAPDEIVNLVDANRALLVLFLIKILKFMPIITYKI